MAGWLAEGDIDLGLFADDPGYRRDGRPVGIDRVVLAGRGSKSTVRQPVGRRVWERKINKCKQKSWDRRRKNETEKGESKAWKENL